ncbi:hypothetical protein EXIGLDRAFT_737423 [Exidia glandulosa HHB12029]|uniref:Uncharacterized protein n=1 Tax=Exidia glandulosa HHB12029 TaxID=1314781 RepID=A0A165IZZ0_EXIGL|nr:hypothetical protein EXIGLDRAFT_737423 [Exidia glandulosa HHB12029]
MKRDARTAQLREDNFVVKLTVEQFEEKFYKPYLPDFDLKDCLLASDEYAGAVRAIRAAERSSKSSTVLEKAAYHPVCAILNKMCDKYASTRYVPDEDRIHAVQASAQAR